MSCFRRCTSEFRFFLNGLQCQMCIALLKSAVKTKKKEYKRGREERRTKARTHDQIFQECLSLNLNLNLNLNLVTSLDRRHRHRRTGPRRCMPASILVSTSLMPRIPLRGKKKMEIDIHRKGYDTCCNTHVMCAERRLLGAAERDAVRHGVPKHKVGDWIRRKHGTCITVLRQTSDGEWGCSVPCASCRYALARLEMRMRCVTPEGWLFVGNACASDAPPSKLTSGQRRGLTS